MSAFVPTAEQREILDHRGPQLVLAGAGVGKTAVLTQRIVDAIHLDGVAPERILALTFTRSAAEEMRERIASDLARRELSVGGHAIWAGTYHAFGGQVVHEFGVRLGVAPTAQLLGDAAKWTLLEKIFDNLRFDTVFESSGARTAGGLFEQVLQFVSDAQHHLLTPEDLSSWLDQIGAITDGGKARQVLRQWTEMTVAYAGFQQAKLAADAIDYGDQISLAVQLLEGFPDVSSVLRNRHTHLFVDEYQDTNPAQRRLLLALAGEANKNLFVIGDDDQAIFRFQGATVRNILELPNEPSLVGTQLAVRSLVLNRRSLAPILNLGNRIAARIGGRRVKSLTAARHDGEAHIGTYVSDTDLDEARWIAQRIVKLRNTARPGSEKADPGAYAVLCRTRRLMEPIIRALVAAGLPVQRAEPTPLLQRWEIDEIRAMLQVLATPAHDVALARVLVAPRWQIGDADLWVMAQWRHARTRDNTKGQTAQVVGDTLLDAVLAADQIPGLSKLARDRLSCLGQEIEMLALVAQRASVDVLVGRVIDAGGYRRELAANLYPDDAEALRNIIRFQHLASGISADGLAGLRAFMTYLDRAEEVGDRDLGNIERPLPVPGAVSVTTVHRAKGLEWLVVFVPGLVKDQFPLKMRADRDQPNRAPYPLRAKQAGLPLFPDSAFGSESAFAAAQLERDDVLSELERDDERRLLYVAVTRARDQLYLTRAHWYGHRKTSADPSVFWEEVVTHESVEDLGAEDPSPSNPGLVGGDDHPTDSYMEKSVRAAVDMERRVAAGEDDRLLRDLLGDEDEEQWVQAKAEGDDLISRLANRGTVPSRPQPPVDLPISSYSALREFETCERRYRYLFLDQLPRRPVAASASGVALHRALALDGLTAGDGDLTDQTELTGDLEATVTDRPDLLEAYRATRFGQRSAHVVEQVFSLAFDTGVIRGVIDRIDRLPEGGVELVDFKTGRRPPDTHLASDLQLPIYALAVEDMYGVPPEQIRASLLFLEIQEEWYLPWDYSRAEVFRVRLRNILHRMRGSKHLLTTNHGSCRGCDFKHICGR